MTRYPQRFSRHAPLAARISIGGQTLFADRAKRSVLLHTAVRPDARDPDGAETTALSRGVLRSV